MFVLCKKFLSGTLNCFGQLSETVKGFRSNDWNSKGCRQKRFGKKKLSGIYPERARVSFATITRKTDQYFDTRSLFPKPLRVPSSAGKFWIVGKGLESVGRVLNFAVSFRNLPRNCEKKDF